MMETKISNNYNNIYTKYYNETKKRMDNKLKMNFEELENVMTIYYDLKNEHFNEILKIEKKCKKIEKRYKKQVEENKNLINENVSLKFNQTTVENLKKNIVDLESKNKNINVQKLRDYIDDELNNKTEYLTNDMNKMIKDVDVLKKNMRKIEESNVDLTIIVDNIPNNVNNVLKKQYQEINEKLETNQTYIVKMSELLNNQDESCKKIKLIFQIQLKN